MRRTLALAALLLPLTIPAPANADGCTEVHCGPCVKKAEWDNVNLGWTLGQVANAFDSWPDVSDIWNPWGPHGTHRRSVWHTPGQCSDGSPVTVYFLPDGDRWIVESKCWNGNCIWAH